MKGKGRGEGAQIEPERKRAPAHGATGNDPARRAPRFWRKPRGAKACCDLKETEKDNPNEQAAGL